jgi:AcrR family transcriptional regulator
VRQTRTSEERILQAAATVFLERGKDGTTMKEIAARAGVNKALLHYYFRSKDRLYERVFAQQLDKFAGQFVDIIPQTDDLKKFLELFVSNYIDRLAAHPELPGFMLWEIRQGGATAGKLIRRRIFGGLKHGTPLDPVIEKALREGVIRPLDPLHFVISLISACVFPFVARPIMERILPDAHFASPEFLEKRKQEILTLIWNGIKADASTPAAETEKLGEPNETEKLDKPDGSGSEDMADKPGRPGPGV